MPVYPYFSLKEFTIINDVKNSLEICGIKKNGKLKVLSKISITIPCCNVVCCKKKVVLVVNIIQKGGFKYF